MMRAIQTIFLGILAAVFFAGCQEDGISLSMNQQRSIVRGTTDNALTLYLDNLDEEKAVIYSERATEIAQQIEDYLNTGSVANLTTGEIQVQVSKLVPDGYGLVLSQILIAVSSFQTDPGSVIGENNIKRLVAACHGIKTCAAEYAASDRKEYISLFRED